MKALGHLISVEFLLPPSADINPRVFCSQSSGTASQETASYIALGRMERYDIYYLPSLRAGVK